MDINEILKRAITLDAVEIIMDVGLPPCALNKNKDLVILDDIKLSQEDNLKVAFSCLGSEQREQFKKKNDVRISYSVPGLGRFLLWCFIQRGAVALRFKVTNLKLKSLDDFPNESFVKKIKMVLNTNKQKLLICYGDNSIAELGHAMINYLNESYQLNIVAISENLFYLHRNKRSIVVQCEVGTDAESFSKFFRSASRFTFDTIYFEDINDFETTQTMLHTAFNARLIIANIKATDAVAALYKVIHIYPPYQHKMIKHEIGEVLCAMIGQKTLKNNAGSLEIINELIINSREIKSIIESSEVPLGEIMNVVEKSTDMNSFDQNIYGLIKNNEISLVEGYRNCTNRDRFAEKYLKGRDFPYEKAKLKKRGRNKKI